jgi:hypothetical protein
MCPWSALPEHLNSPEEWDGKDDDKTGLLGKFRKKYKGWFAFGPRATEKWARFRTFPIVLIALRGTGFWRTEDDRLPAERGEPQRLLIWRVMDWNAYGHQCYVPRVQYWNKWHFALQWPLFLHAHYGSWQFYAGFKRDADRVYWLALYLGRVWK